MHPGSLLSVATIPAEAGSRVALREVLLISDGDNITVGSPLVANAAVIAEVIAQGKGRKVINFKFKAKTRYRRKRGHRQPFTRLSVKEIVIDGATVAQAQPVERKAAMPVAGPAAAASATAVEAPVAEAAAAAPRRRRAAAPAEVATPSVSEAEAAAPAPRRRRAAAPKETQE